MVYYKNELYKLVKSVRNFIDFKEANLNNLIEIQRISDNKTKKVIGRYLFSYSVERNRKALGLQNPIYENIN